MRRRPQIGWLADDKRLHLQDGPIDLVIEARGGAAAIAAAHGAAVQRFDGLLDQLCSELPALRQAADPARCSLQGRVARRMHAAVAPFASDHFITPMAAVAGAVAEEILAAMLGAAALRRAYVNNGGDIALYLAEGEQVTLGLLDRPDRYGIMQLATIASSDHSRGIATSGRHGRSFSLGIADAVTVLARTAAQADAAATIIANAVDLPGHPAIRRCAANQLQPDSDLGGRLVTRDVGALSEPEVIAALDAGSACARMLLAAGSIDGAALRLQGETAVAGIMAIANTSPRAGEAFASLRRGEFSCEFGHLDARNGYHPSRSNTSPRLRGEVGAMRRVRGTLHESNTRREAPHPDLLPAKGGEKEKRQQPFQEGPWVP